VNLHNNISAKYVYKLKHLKLNLPPDID
jgi:hypothetical protein